MATSELSVLLRLIDQGYDKKAWHGPNLRGSIRRVKAPQAGWRPGPNRHNIVEIILHAAYWKYIARRRLLGLKRGSFALKGSNWFPCTVNLLEKDWADAVALLDQEHVALRAAIAEFPEGRLHAKQPDSTVSNAMLIEGIACHDVYHAGQIQLLKALQK